MVSIQNCRVEGKKYASKIMHIIMSDSHKCMGDNGEGSLAAARSLQKAVFFTASHARIHISTTSHMRIHISTRIRYCKSHALRLSMQ